MDHSALIYLMDRDGKFVSPFNLKQNPTNAAADTQTLYRVVKLVLAAAIVDCL